MSDQISDYKLISELKKFNPFATSFMIARQTSIPAEIISSRLTELYKQGQVNKISLKGQVVWYQVKRNKLSYKKYN